MQPYYIEDLLIYSSKIKHNDDYCSNHYIYDFGC